MRIRGAVVVVGLFLGALACGPDPPPPRAQIGDDCSDTRCEDGLACVDLGDGAASSCADPPASCDPEDICGCAVLDEMCPDNNIGSVCISTGSRASLECQLPAGGEGEGEGE